MSINIDLNAIPMIANADLRATSSMSFMYRLLKVTSGTSSNLLYVDVCSATTDLPIGILAMNPPSTESSAGEHVRVALLNISGVMQVRLHNAVTRGDYLGVHTDGSAIGASSLTADNWYIGQAPKDGVAGEILPFVATLFRA